MLQGLECWEEQRTEGSNLPNLMSTKDGQVLGLRDDGNSVKLLLGSPET